MKGKPGGEGNESYNFKYGSLNTKQSEEQVTNMEKLI